MSQLVPVLAVGLLSPGLAVGGVLLMAAPLIIHFFNRRRFKKVAWAAMVFLQKAMAQNRKRLYFEQWLLLALRCLVLGLLGVALARPVGCNAGSAGGLGGVLGDSSVMNVIVIDTSYSMNYSRAGVETTPLALGQDGAGSTGGATHLQRGLLLARQWIEKESGGTQSGGGQTWVLIDAGMPARVLVRQTSDAMVVMEALARIKPGAGTTDLAGAMALASQIIQKESPVTTLVGGADATTRLQTRTLIFSDATRSALGISQEVTQTQAEGLRDPQGGLAAAAESQSALQANARTLAAVSKVYLIRLGDLAQTNVALSGMEVASGPVTRSTANEFVARRVEYGGASKDGEQAENGAAGGLVWSAVPGERLWSGAGRSEFENSLAGISPGATAQSAVLDFSSDGSDKQATYWLISAKTGQADGLAIDDVYREVVRVPRRLGVVVVEGQRGARPLSGSGSFVSLALDPSGARRDFKGPIELGSANTTETAGSVSSPFWCRMIGEDELPAQNLEDVEVLVLADVAELTAEQANVVSGFVKRGGVLMTFLGSNLRADMWDQRMLPLGLMPGPLSGRMEVSEEQAMTLDFVPTGPLHPLLSAFRGAQRSGLDSTRITGWWRVRAGAQVKKDQDGDNTNKTQDRAGETKVVETVLNYRPAARASGVNAGGNQPDDAGGGSSESAAVLVHTLGKGSVITFTTSSGVDGWNDLPAKPAYVTLVHELLRGSIRSGGQWLTLKVGDRLIVPTSLAVSAVPVLQKADGQNVVMDSIAAGGQSQWTSEPLMEPGVYQLSVGQERFPVAVNVLSEEEGDVRVPDAAAVVLAMGDVPLKIIDNALPEESGDAEFAGQSLDFGWSVLALVGGLLVLEMLAAMRLGNGLSLLPGKRQGGGW